MIGDTLAHYKITQKIGAGGMGEVYRATDSKLHRDVAIKVISASYANDPERMARFEREAHVLASLSHGSIAAVYGLEDANGSKALVMELVEGVDLSDRLKQGPLPITDALRTASQVAEALEAAHEHGIIHRDLKPANIKLLPDGRIKLLDFGLAKALEAASAEALADSATLSGGATRAGIIMGTAAYMSPEQATGAPVDKRTDVWAFGVVLFEMLTGQRLFEGQTTSHTLAEVIRAEIDFGRLPATTPPDVRGLLERCLDREPRRRLRDIREARLVIDRLLEQRSGSQHSGSHATASALLPPVPARGLGVGQIGAGVAAGVLVAAAAAWLFWPKPAPVQQLRVEVRLSTQELNGDLGPAFDVSPSGSRIAFVSGGQGEREMRVRQLDQLDSTILALRDNNGEPYHPFFSPDGEWVGFVTATEMRKVPAAGGTPLTITKVNRSRGASWGGDGSIVFAPDPGSGLMRVSAAGGEATPLTTLNTAVKEATHRWPQFLPGDKAVLFTAHTQTAGDFDNATIEVVDIATGTRKVVQKGATFGRYIPTGHLLFVNKGTLFAVPFDVGSLTTSGSPVPVVREVTSSPEGGAQVAFSSTGLLVYLRGAAKTPRFPVVWVDRQGGVTPLLAEAGTYGNPRLSPDGRRLSMNVLRNGNWDIWVLDIERQVMSRLTFDEGTDTEQVWSPDGRELIFGSERGGKPTSLYQKPADGSGEEHLVAQSDFSMWPTTWAPDGRVGFSANRKTFDVGVVKLGDKPEYQWPAASPFVETDPAFSPDNRWMAYASNESGAQQIYVRPYPSGTGRWQISDAGGGFPRWSRDGRELFYRTNTGIMAASIEVSGDSLRTGKPRQAIAGAFRGGAQGLNIAGNAFADYDVSADGKRFVMFPKGDEGVAAEAGLVTVVSAWFDEVTRTAKP